MLLKFKCAHTSPADLVKRQVLIQEVLRQGPGLRFSHSQVRPARWTTDHTLRSRRLGGGLPVTSAVVLAGTHGYFDWKA